MMVSTLYLSTVVTTRQDAREQRSVYVASSMYLASKPAEQHFKNRAGRWQSLCIVFAVQDCFFTLHRNRFSSTVGH